MANHHRDPSPIPGSQSPILSEKPVASTGSGSLTMTVSLAEPILFLQGFERSEYQNRAPAMLRGTLNVHVAKPTKIKAINLTFTGRARTEWPEGIPPAKDEYFEEKELISHLWPFYNALFATESAPFGTVDNIHNDSQISLLPGAVTAIRERERSSSIDRAAQAAQKGYRIFSPGDYKYVFELPIDNSLPETVDSALGSVRYELEATIERPGAFKSKLNGKKEVTIVRSPVEASLEAGDPIVVSRNWEDQLHYDIVIGGKAFPLGGRVPVAFKLTPLAKVRCHRIRILLTEHVEYFARNKKVHRIEPVRKFLLYEHSADGDNVDNLLGDLDDGMETAGPVEFEFNAKIPGCNQVIKGSQRVHPDTTYPNIKIHHWIKIILRLSKADEADPTRRRHFEVSIDSPFHLLSCRCTQSNVALPAYHSRANPNSSVLPPCPCELGEASAEEPAMTRPIHLLRQPSMNPPPFDADIAPPPLVTPPPGYDDIIGNEGGYFDSAGSSSSVADHGDGFPDDDSDSDRELSVGFDELRIDGPSRLRQMHNGSMTSFASSSSSSSGSSSANRSSLPSSAETLFEGDDEPISIPTLAVEPHTVKRVIGA
ncbi:uncharacterized protein V1516DRAFT_630195 [Lipomyces oligophaga]|uniref:uncharacterized protein n=1 Tax=Lipomyces oligophaga TaxID=45792 RepID=UPI0034CD37E9